MLAHREPQVEATAMNPQTLQDVVVSPQVRASHPAGLIEVGKRSLGEFRPSPPQALPAGAPETAAIPNRIAGPDRHVIHALLKAHRARHRVGVVTRAVL